MVVTVNSDSTFNAARDEMKPELKLLIKSDNALGLRIYAYKGLKAAVIDYW
jgi:hypothetical protein